MSDIFDEDSLEIPDEDVSENPQHAVNADLALGQAILESALTPRADSLLRNSAAVIILQIPTAAWAETIKKAVRKVQSRAIIVVATELKRRAGTFERIGADELNLLQTGRPVVYVSHDPDQLLAETVLQAADITITVPSLSANVVRKVVREVTGQRCRGVTTLNFAIVSPPEIINAVRPGSTARECARRISAAVLRPKSIATTAGPTIEHLALTSTVKAWAEPTLFLMKASPFAPIPFAILEGPPGTGKTLIAEALARSAGWSFVPTTIGAWFAASDGALGGVIKSARTFFEQVKSPDSRGVVGFIDEIDALPNRETLDPRSADWWSPVVNYVLTEIDSTSKSGRRVLLLGATNHLARLDPALCRAGRLETCVRVLRPDTEERMAIFRFFLKDELSDADLVMLSRLSVGATPALIQSWTRSAEQIAAASQRPMSVRDLTDLIVPPSSASDEELWAIALHEAGHAGVATHLGIVIEEVSTIGSAGVGGWMRTGKSKAIMTRGDIENTCLICLGGRAADVVLGSGPSSAAAGDIANVNKLIWSAMTELGLHGSLQTDLTLDAERWGPEKQPLRQLIASELDRLMDRASEIVGCRRDGILNLAKVLVEERVVTGDRADAILKSHKWTHQLSCRPSATR